MKKKMLLSACAASLLALTLAGCTQSTAQQADYIGADAAKAIALEAAGIGEADAAFTSAELESRNNTVYYEVDFTAGGQEYDYDIDALTGTVIQHSQKGRRRRLRRCQPRRSCRRQRRRQRGPGPGDRPGTRRPHRRPGDLYPTATWTMTTVASATTWSSTPPTTRSTTTRSTRIPGM